MYLHSRDVCSQSQILQNFLKSELHLYGFSIELYRENHEKFQSIHGNEMLQIVKLEHVNHEYTGRRTYDRNNYIENAPSFTASVGLVGLTQASPNYCRVW